MNAIQKQRHVMTSMAVMASNHAETYIATLLSKRFDKKNNGTLDVICDKLLPVTQHEMVINFTSPRVIFYPENYSDFASLHHFKYRDNGIDVSRLIDEEYVPRLFNKKSMAQWLLVETITDHVEKHLFHGEIIEDLHESILNEQHNFGYFDWYKFGELGK